jgi:ankyrin repeat protein
MCWVTDVYGVPILHEVLRSDNTRKYNLAEYLATNGAVVDTDSGYGVSILTYAVIMDNEDSVDFMLDSLGADPNYVSNEGSLTPLGYAMESDTSHMALRIISKGGRAEIVGDTPYRPRTLTASIDRGWEDVAVAILQSGVEPTKTEIALCNARGMNLITYYQRLFF